MALTATQLRSWADDGMLVLPGFFSDEEIGTVSSTLARSWRERRDDVVVDDLVTSRRARISQLSEEETRHSFKVNDLYLPYKDVRRVALSRRIGAIVAELLQDTPVLCNTLNLEYGSQQVDHVDSLFMTPETPGKLVATWMALEDVHPDAGPLRYYPGSNHIEPYRFGNGGYRAVDAEMERWSDYVASNVDRQRLSEERFLARRGDLFVWSANLLHGGSEICRPGLTRNSLVSHFWSRTDCATRGLSMRSADGGLWFSRPPQPVAGEEAPPPSPVGVGRALYDRLRSLVTSRG